MISNKLKEQYVQILADLKHIRAKNCTQLEISSDLGVSLRKYTDFENGKIINLELLTNVCGYFNKQITLWIK
jgi:transcriptional regulator with XRE-family HTH domain